MCSHENKENVKMGMATSNQAHRREARRAKGKEFRMWLFVTFVVVMIGCFHAKLHWSYSFLQSYDYAIPSCFISHDFSKIAQAHALHIAVVTLASIFMPTWDTLNHTTFLAFQQSFGYKRKVIVLY